MGKDFGKKQQSMNKNFPGGAAGFLLVAIVRRSGAQWVRAEFPGSVAVLVEAGFDQFWGARRADCDHAPGGG